MRGREDAKGQGGLDVCEGVAGMVRMATPGNANLPIGISLPHSRSFVFIRG